MCIKLITYNNSNFNSMNNSPTLQIISSAWHKQFLI